MGRPYGEAPRSLRARNQALDVIDYLPVKELVPGALSWEALREEHAASSSNKDFKSWLSASKRASFTPDQIRQAAQTLDSVPDELVALANLCASL